MRQGLIAIILQLALLAAVRAQTLPVQHYDLHDALPSAMVRDVLQDSLKRMWFATRGGLAMFDGSNWRSWRGDARGELLDLSRLTFDAQGVLWAISDNKRIVRLLGDSLDLVGYPPPKEAAWFGVASFLILEQTGDPLLAYLDLAHIGILRAGSWTMISAEETGHDQFYDLTKLPDKTLVASSSGIFELHLDGGEPRLESSQVEGLPDGPIYKVSPEWERPAFAGGELVRLWFYGPDWIGFTEAGEFTLLATGLEPVRISDIPGYFARLAPDYRGGVFYGSPHALFHIHSRGDIWEIGSEQGLSADGSLSIYVDHEYGIWSLSSRGIDHLPNLAFRNYRQAQGMLADEVSSLLAVGPDSIIIGHNEGLTFAGPSGFRPVPFPEDPAFERVLDLQRLADGSLWMTTSAGLVRYTETDGFQPKKRDLDNPFTSAMVGQGDGFIYTGIHGIGYSDEGMAEYPADEALDQVFVRALARDEAGTLYAGSGMRGVYALNREGLRHYGRMDGGLLDRIMALRIVDDRLLVGSAGGVLHIVGDSLVPYLKEEQRILRPVYLIERDRDGRLWFGSTDGVHCYDGKNRLQYTVEHGLVGRETNRTASLVDSRGRLWFGTASGLSVYDRKLDSRERVPPPEVTLVEISAQDQSWVRFDKPLHLDHQHNDLALRLTVPSYLSERPVEIEYYLEGAMEGFRAPEPLSGELSFLNLPPGSYRFHARVRNVNKVVGPVWSSAELRILAPFYQTVSFRLAAVLLALALVYGLMRAFMQERYARQLRNEVRRQTEELSKHQNHLSELVEQRTHELDRSNLELQREIAQRQQVQQHLEQEHAHLASVFDTVADGIVTINEQGIITQTNREFGIFVGKAPEQLLGERLDRWLPEQESMLDKALEGQVPSEQHAEIEFPEAGYRLLNVQASPLANRISQEREVLVVLRDVTRLDTLEKEVAERHGFHSMVGQSRAMREIYDQIEQLASTPVTVLITGESGTGKELIASALHHSSLRRAGPFVRLNCAALSSSILESELFGHVKGAFTGADSDRAGRFEVARGGTLFLDEIGDISEEMQVKLLRALESGEFERVGDSRTLRTDARIISATNRDLEQRIQQGLFREDLYYRLNVLRFHLPPLRERREDLPLLVDHILAQLAQQHGQQDKTATLSSDVMSILLRYSWPGNIRELRNCLEHAYILGHGSLILPSHLPESVRQAGPGVSSAARASLGKALGGAGSEDLTLHRDQSELEQRARIERALEATLAQMSKAAELLGVSRNTLYRKMKQWKIDKPEL